jgi:uncharacterized cupredoxin-like copper-binding protein
MTRHGRILPIGLLAAGLALHDAAHFVAGVPGDPNKAFRIIEVVMREDDSDHMSYAPARIEVKRGEQVKLVIRNAGAFVHELVLADEKANLKHAELMKKYPDMEHDDPNGKTVQPQASAEILWRFTRRGTFEYACLIPGHRKAGMLGHVVVK